MTNRRPYGFRVRAISVVAVVFGLLTIREGGLTLSGDEAAVTAAGNYVPFVLWFNFVAGFAYVIAGAGLWVRQRWAARTALGIAVATLVVFAAFIVHAATGGGYEMRTVFAMTLRSAAWVVIAAIGWRVLIQGADRK